MKKIYFNNNNPRLIEHLLGIFKSNYTWLRRSLLWKSGLKKMSVRTHKKSFYNANVRRNYDFFFRKRPREGFTAHVGILPTSSSKHTDRCSSIKHWTNTRVQNPKINRTIEKNLRNCLIRSMVCTCLLIQVGLFICELNFSL